MRCLNYLGWAGPDRTGLIDEAGRNLQEESRTDPVASSERPDRGAGGDPDIDLPAMGGRHSRSTSESRDKLAAALLQIFSTGLPYGVELIRLAAKSRGFCGKNPCSTPTPSLAMAADEYAALCLFGDRLQWDQDVNSVVS